MKKLILTVTMLICLFAVGVQAQDATPSTVDPKILTFPLSGSGDLIYLFKPKAVAAGAGIDFARIYDFVNLRLEYARLLNAAENANFIGPNVGIELNKLIAKIPGGTWLMENTKVTIGGGVMLDLADVKASTAWQPDLYLGIVKLF